MNYFLSLIFFVMSILSCSNESVITYNEGIRKCQEEVAKNQAQRPDRIILASRTCILGCTIPDVNTQTITGKKIDREYFKDKFGVINFWFIGCPPCVKEIPNLNAIAAKFGKEKFYYLAIGLDSKEDIAEFLIDHPWDFDQVENGSELLEGDFKNIWGYPTTFFVNRDGVIMHAVGGIHEGNEHEIVASLEALVH